MILKILKLAEDIRDMSPEASHLVEKIASKLNKRKKYLLIDILEMESIVSKERAEPINSDNLLPSIKVDL